MGYMNTKIYVLTFAEPALLTVQAWVPSLGVLKCCLSCTTVYQATKLTDPLSVNTCSSDQQSTQCCISVTSYNTTVLYFDSRLSDSWLDHSSIWKDIQLIRCVLVDTILLPSNIWLPSNQLSDGGLVCNLSVLDILMAWVWLKSTTDVCSSPCIPRLPRKPPQCKHPPALQGFQFCCHQSGTGTVHCRISTKHRQPHCTGNAS